MGVPSTSRGTRPNHCRADCDHRLTTLIIQTRAMIRNEATRLTSPPGTPEPALNTYTGTLPTTNVIPLHLSDPLIPQLASLHSRPNCPTTLFVFSSSAFSPSKPMSRIVIIGAGPAGINAAQTFAKQLKPSDNTEIVILEKSNYYYHTVGTPRAYTEETYTPKLFIPYDDAIPANAKSFVRIIRAVATGILPDQNQVTYQPIGSDDKPTSETRSVSFDYLIIATGSTYTVPIKPDPINFSRAATEQKLREVRDHIARANSILIVGGGAVGCEVAGDIASHFPTKKVTLLEGRDKLIAVNDIKDKARTKLMDSLKELKVEVILGERLEERLTGNSFGRRALRTTRGRVIESDVQLLCGGFNPVADIVETMDPSLIDDRGSVRVNDLFQLDHPRYSHIFALGDMTNHNTPKMAYWAGEQAKHLAGELVAVIQKKQSRVSKPFPPVTTEMLMVPLGPDGGVGQLPMFGGWVVGNFTVRMFKSKDMFAGMTWGSLGAKVPK